MTQWSGRRSASGILMLVMLLGACGGGTSVGSDPVAATAGPTADLTASPTVAVTPGPTAANEPPAAWIAVDGGDAASGQLGSYTWNEAGSDSPWLPGTPIAVGAGETLMVTFDDPLGISSWTARRVPAGSTDGSGAVGVGSGGSSIAFALPEPGEWSVEVTVQFADGIGSASWYWHITVR
ncbi:MAG: hypothetical protein H0T59_09620 [Chloroflexi bacterium]|nr:hypothetical protein [Chloroflexota bacterium]